MTAVFGIFFFAFIVFFIMAMINFLRKNMQKLKRNGLIAIACFVISMIAVGVSGSVTVTPKEEAAPAAKPAAETTPAAEPAAAKETKTEEPAAKEPTDKEWEATYQKMVLDETQSYITSSTKKALSKDAYESRLGVIEKYSPRVGKEKLEGFSRLTAAVKANDLDETKAIYKELGGEDFPELNQDAKPVELTEAPPSTPAGDAVAITAAEFTKIKNGMSYEQVATIIGGPGELLSETGNKGDEFHTVMYMWYGADRISNANFMFQGEKLINKAQLGLK